MTAFPSFPAYAGMGSALQDSNSSAIAKPNVRRMVVPKPRENARIAMLFISDPLTLPLAGGLLPRVPSHRLCAKGPFTSDQPFARCSKAGKPPTLYWIPPGELRKSAY
jgi:hypothetical protein